MGPLEKICNLHDDEVKSLKKSYRQHLAGVLRSINRYKGNEAGYESIMELLIEFEDWLSVNFTDEFPKRLSAAQEQEVCDLFHTHKKNRSILDLLSMFGERLDNCLNRLDENRNIQSILEKLNILHIKLDGVILPPGQGGIKKGNGDVELKEKREENRLEELVIFLNRHKIYTDDLIVCSGVLMENQMRGQSYYIVEIPRLNKQVIVCNEVGEATFVTNEILSRGSLMKTSKEDLEERFPNQVRRIVFYNKKNWENELENALFGEAGSDFSRNSHLTKVDVINRELVMQELRLKYTSAQWLEIKNRDRRLVKSTSGQGYSAIANLFGINIQANFSDENHLRLGKAIFGQDDLAIAEVWQKKTDREALLTELSNDKEKWKHAIKEAYTFENWMKINPIRLSLTFHGKSIHDLGKIFGLKRVGNLSAFLQLTLAIFGEDMKADQIDEMKLEIAKSEERIKVHSEAKPSKSFGFKKVDINEEVTQKVLDELKKKYTLETWLSMSVMEKRELNILGNHYIAIARILGHMEVILAINPEIHLKMAKLIFGNHNQKIQNEIIEIDRNKELLSELGKDMEKWKLEIRKKFTYEKWCNQSHEDRLQFSLYGVTLQKLSRYLKLSQLFRSNQKLVFLEMTFAIYDGFISAEDLDKLKFDINEIKEKENRLRELGVGRGQKKSNREIVKMATREKLTEWIREEMTVEKWLASTSDWINDWKVHTLGIHKIKSIFGIVEKLDRRKDWFLLGRKIFGEDQLDLKNAYEECLILEDVDKLKEALRQKYTLSEWVSWTVVQKRNIWFGGKGLAGIANILGIVGDPVSYEHVHLRLAAIIFDEHELNDFVKPRLDVFDKQLELGDDLNKWRVEFRAHYGKQELMALTTHKRRDIVVHGMGLTYLGRIFGIKKSVLSNVEAFEELIEKIYG